MALRLYPGAEILACDLVDNGLRTGTLHSSRLRHCALDIRDPQACGSLLGTTQPTHIMHAAAITAGPPGDMADVNVSGSENVMVAAAHCSSLRRFVFLSSSAVYGSPTGTTACDEAHPLDLSGLYAQTKYAVEQRLVQWGLRQNISTVAARLGPCYGPGEVPGAFRPGISLVGQLVEAMRGNTSVAVSGEDYCRDWTHLDDIARAVLALVFAPRLSHSLYNVSGGVSMSAVEVIQFFIRHGLCTSGLKDTEMKLRLRAEDGRKALVIDRLCADTDFLPVLDWRQRLTDLLDPAR